MPSLKIELSDRIEPMSRMRKKIAKHMIDSQHISPHVHSTKEVDVSNIVNFKKENQNAFKNKYGVKLTYTPIIL